MKHPALSLALREYLRSFELVYFEVLLEAFGGCVIRVAKHAGLERTYLYRKLKALGIDPTRFRRPRAKGRETSV